jgi:hypothetical protein
LASFHRMNMIKALSEKQGRLRRPRLISSP